MQAYTRGEKFQFGANVIAVVAALISLIGAGISAWPLYLEHNSQVEHRDALVKALASGERFSIKTARAHVTAKSPADVFLQRVDDWWYAADWAAPGVPTPEPGSYQSQERGYKVCLPKLLPGDQVCVELSDFVYDPETELITRFSVDGYPVDTMSWKEDGAADLAPKDAMPIDLRAIGRIDLVGQEMRCVAYTMRMKQGDSKAVITFKKNAFLSQDIQEKTVAKRLVWPSRITRFETATGVLCVPNYGGWVWIARQKSAKNTEEAGDGFWVAVR